MPPGTMPRQCLALRPWTCLQVKERRPARVLDLRQPDRAQKIGEALTLARTGITVALRNVHSERKTYKMKKSYAKKAVLAKPS